MNVRSPQSCSRDMDTSSATLFQVQCESDQSLARYATDLFLARSAEIQASSGVSSSADVVAVQLRHVAYYDSVLDVTTDITDVFISNNCATTFYEDVSTSSGFDRFHNPCLFTSNETWSSIASNVANASAPIMFCASVVRDIMYSVNHSVSAQANIQAVYADVVLTDVATSMSEKSTLTQSFGVEFSSASDTQKSTSNGNLVTRYFLLKLIIICFSSKTK